VALGNSFLVRHLSLLLFSIFQILFTAPGQTFLIALFVPHIFDSLDITRTSFATVYSLATLSASFLLNPAGQLIDKIKLKTMVLIDCLAMVTGCLLIAFASTLGDLFFGFFVLRLFGQGVLGLTASATLGKAFHKNRAKAMGIMTLGFPLSEAIYPGFALLCLSLVGWRDTYILFAISFIVFMLPVQWWLLSITSYKEGEFLDGEKTEQDIQREAEDDHYHLPISTVAKNYKIYVLILASCVPPVIMTGLFFHQDKLLALHGWSEAWVGIGLMVYAVSKAFGSIVLGPYIDKHGPVGMFSIMIMMLGVGTLLAAFGGPAKVILVYFAIMGFALGLSSPVMNVVWPNMFGTKHLGSIKGFVSMFRNGLTALGPLPPAIAMDMGIAFDTVLLFTGIVALSFAIIPLVMARLEPRMRFG
jgi:MFS family permease